MSPDERGLDDRSHLEPGFTVATIAVWVNAATGLSKATYALIRLLRDSLYLHQGATPERHWRLIGMGLEFCAWVLLFGAAVGAGLALMRRGRVRGAWLLCASASAALGAGFNGLTWHATAFATQAGPSPPLWTPLMCAHFALSLLPGGVCIALSLYAFRLNRGDRPGPA